LALNRYTSVKPGTSASTHLDFIRGMAALVVYATHIRELFYPEYHEVAAGGFTLSGFYLVTKMGHAAVLVFFVLSGYLVGGSVLKDLFADRWSWKNYLLKRGTRLYIVLIPALLLTVFWDATSARWFGSLPLPWFDPGSTLIPSHTGISTFVCNLFFLQTIISPPYGSDGALWSLSWEWWYYILFPCCLLALKSKRRVLYTLLAVAVVALVGWKITLYFAIWMMGASIGLWPDHWRKRFNISVLLIALVGALVVDAVVDWKIGSDALMFVADLGVGLTTALLIGALLKNTQTKSSGAYALISHRLALLSYTLYVVHAPFLVFMRNAFVRKPLNPTLASVPLVLTIAVLGLLYASVVWWAAEARTDDVREMIGRKLGIAQAPPKEPHPAFQDADPDPFTATHRPHRSA